MTADLVPVTDVQAIEALDPKSREIAVTRLLEESRSWLATAMAATDPTPVAQLRAWLESVEQWTRRFNLAKEIQLDAQEMVRRAERGIGLSIRKGQEEGDVRRRGQGGGQAPGSVRPRVDSTMSSPEDFASHSDLVGNGAGIYHLTDDVTDEQFDSAIEEAKAEGNLSRANVVRKVKGETTTPQKRAADDPQRLERIQTLAGKGWTSTQIAREIGNSEEYVRQLARDNGIDINADRLVGSRRIDSTKVAREAVYGLDGIATTLRLINYDDIDPSEAAEWATSLTDSIRALNRFAKQIKEMTHEH